MPKFRIVVEVKETKILSKEFEAESLAQARSLAEQEGWIESENGWENDDSHFDSSIQDSLCSEVTD